MVRMGSFNISWSTRKNYINDFVGIYPSLYINNMAALKARPTMATA